MSTCRSLIRKWLAVSHSHLNTFSKFTHAFDGKSGAKRAKWTYLASLALALCTPCSSLSDEKSLVCGSLRWQHLVEWSTTSTRMGPWYQDAQKLVGMVGMVEKHQVFLSYHSSCWKVAPNTWNHPWFVPGTPTRTPSKKVWNITNHTFSIQLVPKRP